MSGGDAGVVFNIQRFSIHDGPGIRDLVFVKGCPLRCAWCSNPESQNRYPEISLCENRCIGYSQCGWCKEACATGAITFGKEDVSIDRELCNNCGKCAEVCPAQAITLIGKYMSVDDVTKIVEEDSVFYSQSGGGLTVSGGEPLSQSGFVGGLLKHCRERGVHTAIETSGYGSWEDLANICRYSNVIFYDIKCLDSCKHKASMGVANELILDNIKKVSDNFPATLIIARTPIIPGFNDSEEEIRAIRDFLSEIKSVSKYELLPYHRFGEAKYHQIGRQYTLSDIRPPTPEDMTRLRGAANL